MSGVEKFWSCDAQNLFCVRASDYDRDTQALLDSLQTADTACFLSIVENKRLEGKVKQLREALQAIRVENDHHLVYDAEIESIVNSALSTANGEVTE